jgi:flagellar motor switch/type III secretory pathway protein FliN
MDVRPFVVWGDSALAAVEGRVRAALEGWSREWGAAGRFEVRCRAATRDAERESIRIGEGLAEAIEAALFEGAPRPGQPRGRGRTRARATTCSPRSPRPFAASPPSRECSSRSPCPMRSSSPARGRSIFRVEFEGVPIEWIVAHAELARVPEALSPASPALQPLDAAVHAVGITLQAQVGSIEIDVAALDRLAEGDVIRLGTRVDHPLAIVGPDGATVFHGHLGRTTDCVRSIS